MPFFKTKFSWKFANEEFLMKFNKSRIQWNSSINLSMQISLIPDPTEALLNWKAIKIVLSNTLVINRAKTLMDFNEIQVHGTQS